VASSRAKEDVQDFTSNLIRSLNKEHGSKIAYNLSVDESPTEIKRWISTGSRQLDYIIANRPAGGIPEGRIIEIFGPPSIGKSHIAIQIARSAQQMGGIVVYIDTENATSIENLRRLGIDVARRFVFVETACTEEVFAIAENTIKKSKAISVDVPILILWDSVAASTPKAELLGDYDKESIGLQARAISKGMRKITQVIGAENVTFVCLNQTRTKIGVMYGDPTTTPGGMAIPFHASVRIKLGAGQKLKNKEDDIIGIHVSAKTIKNKVASPFRTCHFEIHFGIGIKEHEQLFDALRRVGSFIDADGNESTISGTGGWKTFTVVNTATGEEIIQRKFFKAEFDEVLNDEECRPYLDEFIKDVMVKTLETDDMLNEQIIDGTE
tara:strand:+ start:2716 stop:3861 length:1146 start_codon:yes stop_codon:yes gene_type:complete